MNTILEIHRSFYSLVHNTFSMDSGFVASLDKACRKFVNKNFDNSNTVPKCPEFLARHVDNILKNSSKSVDVDLNDALNDVVI